MRFYRSEGGKLSIVPECCGKCNFYLRGTPVASPQPRSEYDQVTNAAGGRIEDSEGPALPEFPAFLRRAAHFAYRNMDAVGGPVVAGLPVDWIARVTRPRDLRRSDSDLHPVAGRRIRG